MNNIKVLIDEKTLNKRVEEVAKEIEKDYEGDVSFPEINKSEWKVTNTEKGPADGVNDFEYNYVTYERI